MAGRALIQQRLWAALGSLWDGLKLFSTDVQIVLNRLSCGCFFTSTLRRERTLWRHKAQAYLDINQMKWGEKKYSRIEFLVGHLNVVDDKTGRLLQFQALILAAISVGVGTLWPHYEKLEEPGPHLALVIIFWVAYGLWGLATVLCLWEIRRVAWANWGEERLSTVRAESVHALHLIREVISRSAKFRVAVPLTFASVALLSASLPLLLCHCTLKADVKKPTPLVRSPKPPMSPVLVGPFKPGVGCSDSSDLQNQVKKAVCEIRAHHVSRLLIVGSADAVPIAWPSADQFGNNVGLALARARCVAGWLLDSLGTQKPGVRMDFSVQDATGRTWRDRHRGDADDRKVRIEPLPDSSSGHEP